MQTMTDALLPLVESVVFSPWLYVVLFVLAAVDGFFPLVPSETSVITAGVFAAAGDPSVVLVVVAAALGAFAGDQIAYAVGRRSGPRMLRRARQGTRRGAAIGRAQRALDARGGAIIVASRYFPGARTAVSMTAGAVGYEWRRFTTFGVAAAVTWATYAGLVGFLGGAAFERNVFMAVLLGLAFAAAVTVMAELGRRLLRPARAQPESTEPRGESQPPITAQRRSAAFEGVHPTATPPIDPGPRRQQGFIHDPQWIQAQACAATS
jgi:membrane protein DedA with SNARE-associated domain